MRAHNLIPPPIFVIVRLDSQKHCFETFIIWAQGPGPKKGGPRKISGPKVPAQKRGPKSKKLFGPEWGRRERWRAHTFCGRSHAPGGPFGTTFDPKTLRKIKKSPKSRKIIFFVFLRRRSSIKWTLPYGKSKSCEPWIKHQVHHSLLSA